jgi:hypothetical protein
MTPISQASLQGLNVKQLHDLKQQWQRAISGCAEGSENEREARANVAKINHVLAQRVSHAPRP